MPGSAPCPFKFRFTNILDRGLLLRLALRSDIAAMHGKTAIPIQSHVGTGS